MPNLEATFETLVDTFVFLDKNEDGYVSKNETVQAINEKIWSPGASLNQMPLQVKAQTGLYGYKLPHLLEAVS
ncbi:hypothetical protein Fmac_029178 [Flemingia macrophylla]|uniref:EF-hand domain-containing protein n=1 Tax=Flemingia macrophylla TaxID=520843 RepID=A0ABD1L9L3_9FABA